MATASAVDRKRFGTEGERRALGSLSRKEPVARPLYSIKSDVGALSSAGRTKDRDRPRSGTRERWSAATSRPPPKLFRSTAQLPTCIQPRFVPVSSGSSRSVAGPVGYLSRRPAPSASPLSRTPHRFPAGSDPNLVRVDSYVLLTARRRAKRNPNPPGRTGGPRRRHLARFSSLWPLFQRRCVDRGAREISPSRLNTAASCI